LVGKLKGAFGTVRDLVVDDEGKYIVTVSVDRYLRCYDTETRKLLQQHNLNTRLTSVCFAEVTAEVEERETQK
jgi:WD40 repeat protein